MLAEAFVWLGLHAEINESHRGVCLDDESPIYLKNIKCEQSWQTSPHKKIFKNWNMKHWYAEENKQAVQQTDQLKQFLRWKLCYQPQDFCMIKGYWTAHKGKSKNHLLNLYVL